MAPLHSLDQENQNKVQHVLHICQNTNCLSRLLHVLNIHVTSSWRVHSWLEDPIPTYIQRLKQQAEICMYICCGIHVTN